MYNMEKIGFKVILMTIVELIDAKYGMKKIARFFYIRAQPRKLFIAIIYMLAKRCCDGFRVQQWVHRWQFIGGPL